MKRQYKKISNQSVQALCAIGAIIALIALYLLRNPGAFPNASNIVSVIVEFLFALFMFGCTAGSIAFYPIFKMVDSIVRLIFPRFYARTYIKAKFHSKSYCAFAILICGIILTALTIVSFTWLHGVYRTSVIVGFCGVLVFSIAMVTDFPHWGKKSMAARSRVQLEAKTIAHEVQSTENVTEPTQTESAQRIIEAIDGAEYTDEEIDSVVGILVSSEFSGADRDAISEALLRAQVRANERRVCSAKRDDESDAKTGEGPKEHKDATGDQTK
jgi:hypothetical protein